MKVVALVSGGKDSTYAMMKCEHYGHQIVALANLMPVDEAQDELDSYMHHGLSYNMTPGDEVEDMFILLKEVKRQIPSVNAVSSGAIASDYQRLRVESVCSRLGLVSLAYLWKQDQSLLLRQMIQSEIIAITVKVAAIGLDPSKHLGKEIAQLECHLHKLKGLYGINVCGEGGEYETLTLDCPLFKNARVVLDKSQVILHSSDQIAPVGVLHPLEYHLEKKSVSLSNDKSNELSVGEFGSVCEVLGDCLGIVEAPCKKNDVNCHLALDTKRELHISKSRMNGTFSIACWLPDGSQTSADVREDLEVVLTKIEVLLNEHDCSWENVLYIHLYIADMNEFAPANDQYLKFITHEKCRFGVPSRSTIELPLLQAGLGRVYIEILFSKDNTKNVLHVQSISEWAPSCIGPYSQATLHTNVLHMAGQLGLDPPTMLLREGGPALEFQQALANAEAVAKCFNCSISTSAVALIIYCSKSLSPTDRACIENQKNVSLAEMKLQSLSGSHSRVPALADPVVLYILVPDLPKSSPSCQQHIRVSRKNSDDKASNFPVKARRSTNFIRLFRKFPVTRFDPRESEVGRRRVAVGPAGGGEWRLRHNCNTYERAVVEVKPLLYNRENLETPTGSTKKVVCTRQAYWGFQPESWHNDCLQKCTVSGRICVAVVSITKEIATKICSDNISNEPTNQVNTDKQLSKMAEFCIYLLDSVLLEDDISWDDVLNLRIYFTASPHASHGLLSKIFTNAFNEFGEMSKRIDSNDKGPIFNLVPVLGAGMSLTSMDESIFTWQKSISKSMGNIVKLLESSLVKTITLDSESHKGLEPEFEQLLLVKGAAIKREKVTDNMNCMGPTCLSDQAIGFTNWKSGCGRRPYLRRCCVFVPWFESDKLN
ncbi:endoribonuclease L-PSP family protein [Striga asiatica]|uniref:Diphthine--ammonia ligase n=1 Tax=Striga asiatica TaxID=4170 RepID=A0A5A7NWU6_STRAF|nr:endoribonuclease L-PSP family protein [Striga asiatica]